MSEYQPQRKSEIIHFRGGDGTLDVLRNEPPAKKIKRIKNIIKISKTNLKEAQAALKKIAGGASMPYGQEVYEDSVIDYTRSIEELEQHLRSLEAQRK